MHNKNPSHLGMTVPGYSPKSRLGRVIWPGKLRLKFIDLRNNHCVKKWLGYLELILPLDVMRELRELPLNIVKCSD